MFGEFNPKLKGGLNTLIATCSSTFITLKSVMGLGIAINGGDATKAANAAGGAVNLTGGTASGTAVGGAVSLIGGAGSGASGSTGGAISILSGASSGSLAAAGNITIQCGDNVAGGGNGTLLLQGSTGGTIGGAATIQGGAAAVGSGLGTGGKASLIGGAADATSGSKSGAVDIKTSNSSGDVVGAITIAAGNVGTNNTQVTGGTISVTSGKGSNGASGWPGGPGGTLTITSGVGGDGGSGQNGGAGGALSLVGGAAGATGNVNGGDITLTSGTATGTGVPGNIVTKSGVCDQAYSKQVPTTGFSITIAAATQTLILDPAGTLATGTITMPAKPADGQQIRITCTQIITALTVSANAGQSITNAPTAFNPNLTGSQGYEYMYVIANTTWYRLQ